MGRDPFKEIVMEIYNSEIENAILKGKLIANEENKLKYKEEWDKSMLEVAKNMIKNKCTKEQVINSTKITEKQFLALLKV
ncbi:MAG: hypothetical protein MJ224_08135 [archaeon]|nr:hypothetical protein [archaeon]